MSIVTDVFEISKKAPHRNSYQVLAKLMEEVGELAEEVNIKKGFIKKEPGKDGIKGEAIDVIQCALDIIFINDIEVTEEELESIMKSKLTKWSKKWRHEKN